MHVDRIEERSLFGDERNEIWVFECDGMMQSRSSSPIFRLQVSTAAEQNLCDCDMALSARQN